MSDLKRYNIDNSGNSYEHPEGFYVEHADVAPILHLLKILTTESMRQFARLYGRNFGEGDVGGADRITALEGELLRLREKVARLCDLNKRVGDRCRLDHGWSAQDVTDHREELSERDALFTELDAQEKGNG